MTDAPHAHPPAWRVTDLAEGKLTVQKPAEQVAKETFTRVFGRTPQRMSEDIAGCPIAADDNAMVAVYPETPTTQARMHISGDVIAFSLAEAAQPAIPRRRMVNELRKRWIDEVSWRPHDKKARGYALALRDIAQACGIEWGEVSGEKPL